MQLGTKLSEARKRGYLISDPLGTSLRRSWTAECHSQREAAVNLVIDESSDYCYVVAQPPEGLELTGGEGQGAQATFEPHCGCGFGRGR